MVTNNIGILEGSGKETWGISDAEGSVKSERVRSISWKAAAGGLGIGLFCCILPYLLYTAGLQHVEAGKAAILATIEPFVAALLGILLFHEEITFFKLLGMAAIFGAVLLLNRPILKKET